jgi:hypothetical protein
MGWFFGCFVVLCAALIVPVWLHDTWLIYWITVVLCITAVLAYVATRLVAFPDMSGHVGDWFDPWGMVGVTSELFTVSTALLALLPPDARASKDTLVQVD